RAARRRVDGALAGAGTAAVADGGDHARLRRCDRTMSQQKKNEAALGEPFSEEAVADYLQRRPEFFERHPTLLLRLKLPHETNGFTVSLIERQVSMLRQRNGELERQLKDLISVAKVNDSLVEKI